MGNVSKHVTHPVLEPVKLVVYCKHVVLQELGNLAASPPLALHTIEKHYSYVTHQSQYSNCTPAPPPLTRKLRQEKGKQ